jgi:uncharacterized Zn finger protein
MFQYNGSPISIDRAFTAPDGTKYANLRNPAIRQALGVTEVADPPYFDQRFYWGVDNPKLLDDREEVDENGDPLWVQEYNPLTEMMQDTNVRLVTKGLKSQWIAQVKDTAGKMLAQTDWMVIRKAERVVEIPESTKTFRAAVVAEANRIESAIATCTTVEELIAVINNQSWPKE